MIGPVQRERIVDRLTASAVAQIHLRSAQLCLDCDVVFAGPGETCPACAGTKSHPLATWLDRKEAE